MLSLKGKVALVTGCGSLGPGWGNGKAIATLFARRGATVMGLDLDAAAALETQRTIEAEGGACYVATCDVTDAAQVRATIDECLSRFGRLDILVNNVGRSEPGGAVDMNEAVWDQQFDVNMKSAFLTCKFAIPVMER